MNLRVIDYIKEANDGRVIPRAISKIQYVVVHRCGLSLAETPEKLVEGFTDTSPGAAGSWTGGQVPYTFLITTDGRCYQLLDLGDVGWHAKRFSITGIGVAVAGDFRHHSPTQEQTDSLEELCVLLSYWIGREYVVVGHTELPMATGDVSKVCPGKYLNMKALRQVVSKRVSDTRVLDAQAKSLVLMNYGLKV